MTSPDKERDTLRLVEKGGGEDSLLASLLSCSPNSTSVSECASMLFWGSVLEEGGGRNISSSTCFSITGSFFFCEESEVIVTI